MYIKILKPTIVIFMLIMFFLPTSLLFSEDNKKCTKLVMKPNIGSCTAKSPSGAPACGIYWYEIQVKKEGKCDIIAYGWRCHIQQVSIPVGKQTCKWQVANGGSCIETIGALKAQNYDDCSHTKM